MNLKNTLILFGILLTVLMIFGLTVELRKTVQDETFLFPALHNDPKVDIVTVELTRGDKTYEITKATEGNWSLKSPDNSQEVWRIPDVEMRSIIDQIKDARKIEEADTIAGLTPSDVMEGKIKPGIEKSPLAKVVLRTKDADKQYELYLGGVSAFNVFVVAADRPKHVIAVPRENLSSILIDDVNKLRARDLLNVDAVSARGLTIAHRDDKQEKELKLSLTREGQWRFDAPPYGIAALESAGGKEQPKIKNDNKDKALDRPGVRSLFDDLNKLTVASVQDFEPMGQKTFADFGLVEGKAALRIEVEQSKGLTDKGTTRQVLLVGNLVPSKDKDKKQFYARLLSDQYKYVVKVDGRKLQPLLDAVDNPKSLRSLDLAFFELTVPNAVEIKMGQKSKDTVQLVKIAPNFWKIHAGDQSYKASPAAIEGDTGLLGALRGKGEIKDFDDPVEAGEAKTLDTKLGFDTPTAEVAVYIDALTKAKDAGKKGKDAKVKSKDADKAGEERKIKKDAQPVVRLVFGNTSEKEVWVKRTLTVDDKKTISRVKVPLTVLEKVNPPQGYLAFLEKELPAFNVAAASKLELTRDKDTFVLEKQTEGKGDKAKDVWKLIEPKDSPVKNTDEGNILELLDKLRDLKVVTWVQKVGPKEELPKELKNPGLVVKITAKGADGDKKAKAEHRVYQFGSSGEVGKDSGVYARIEGQELVFLAPSATVTFLRDVELRDRTLFKVDADKVKQLSARWVFPKQVIYMELERKKGDVWEVPSSDSALTGFPRDNLELNKDKVTSLVRNLAHLKVLRYVSFKGEPKPEYKLKPSAVQLKLTFQVEGTKEPYTLLVGAEDKGKTGYYAQSNALPGVVFLVEKDPFESLRSPDLEYFNTKNLK